MITRLEEFNEIYCLDFEFHQPDGHLPEPLCLVVYELRSHQKHTLWRDELIQSRPPFHVGPRALFIAFYASAEWSCHLALDWPLPFHIIDLYIQFRNLTNGHYLPCGRSLLGALTFFGLAHLSVAEKTQYRDLAIRGGPYTADEKQALLDYCESDVIALAHLWEKMAAHIDVPYALLRGRYTRAVAHMEHVGVPIDTGALTQLRSHRSAIQDALIQKVNDRFEVYEDGVFKHARFEAYLKRQQIPWVRTTSGRLDLQKATFKSMVQLYPELAPLYDLREQISQTRLEQLAVGPDGRNRTLLSMFQSKTGRNQPSTSKFIFGPASWMRSLIKPPPGYGLAYIDYEQQEFAIAAVLSGDAKMQAAYTSGDPYLTFGKQAGAIPPDATKASHSALRDQFKVCALAVQYGMSGYGLARNLVLPLWQSQELIDLHKRTYPQFWLWSDRAVSCAVLFGSLHTRLGWTIHVPPRDDTFNPRSLGNFPMQANGAEILRLACCYATEAGIRVCAPIHDALLIEAPLQELDTAIALTQSAMEKASRDVLDGFPLRTDVEVIKYPARYMDKRGKDLWNFVWDEVLSVQTHEEVNIVI